MYELVQASDNCYYIQCPAKIGIVKLNNTEVCLIDSGNDKEAGKKVRKILDANGLKESDPLKVGSKIKIPVAN